MSYLWLEFGVKKYLFPFSSWQECGELCYADRVNNKILITIIYQKVSSVNLFKNNFYDINNVIICGKFENN